MMLHNGRCGSTVVGDLLVQNPNIHWASELYAKLKIAKWKEENQQEFAYLAKEPIARKDSKKNLRGRIDLKTP